MTNLPGGSFQIARKILSSELWVSKPATWKIIWIYILGRVSHKNDGKLIRGEGFFQWNIERRNIGIDISEDILKKASSYFVKSGMMSTRRSTRGVYIKVSNYDLYQTLDNYRSTRESTREALEKHSDITNNKYINNIHASSKKKSVNKNMKTYNENDFSLEGIPTVDLDGQKLDSLQEKETKKRVAEVAMVDRILAEYNKIFEKVYPKDPKYRERTEIPTLRKQIKQALKSYTADEIISYMPYYFEDKFYDDVGHALRSMLGGGALNKLKNQYEK